MYIVLREWYFNYYFSLNEEITQRRYPTRLWIFLKVNRKRFFLKSSILFFCFLFILVSINNGNLCIYSSLWVIQNNNSLSFLHKITLLTINVFLSMRTFFYQSMRFLYIKTMEAPNSLFFYLMHNLEIKLNAKSLFIQFIQVLLIFNIFPFQIYFSSLLICFFNNNNYFILFLHWHLEMNETNQCLGNTANFKVKNHLDISSERAGYECPPSPWKIAKITFLQLTWMTLGFIKLTFINFHD